VCIELTMKLSAVVVVAAVAAAVTQAAIEADLVKSLPGLDFAFPSKQYSGYLGVGGGKFLHYQFVESERSPSSDPGVFCYELFSAIHPS
jgi:hypothetical protein